MGTPLVAFQLRLLVLILVAGRVIPGKLVEVHGLVLERGDALVVEVGGALQFLGLSLECHDPFPVATVLMMIDVSDFLVGFTRAHVRLFVFFEALVKGSMR